MPVFFVENAKNVGLTDGAKKTEKINKRGWPYALPAVLEAHYEEEVQ